MFLLGRVPDARPPVALSAARRGTGQLFLGRTVVSNTGVDLTPAYTRGCKLVPWDGIEVGASRKPVYPKFDGVSSMLHIRDGICTACNVNGVSVWSGPRFVGSYTFLAEECKGFVKGPEQDVSVFVIVGVMAVGLAQYDPNDMDVLVKTTEDLEKYLLRAGILVTSPSLMHALRGDTIGLSCNFRGSDATVFVPVDGINVAIGDRYGNFIKPPKKCTVDIDPGQLDDVNEALEMAMLDTVVEQIEGGEGIGEYILKGRRLVRLRDRPDKKYGASPVRISQDIVAMIETSAQFPRCDNVWQLFNSVLNRMTTFRSGKAERAMFFSR